MPQERFSSFEISSTGRNVYEVKGNPTSLSWRRFLPQTSTSENPETPDIDRSKAVFYFPSWGITEKSISAGEVGQAFADTSGLPTYTVDTRMDHLTPESADQEAEAARRFIETSGIKEVTLTGSSHGGRWAVTVAAYLQEQNPDINVHGIILLGSISLYNQRSKQLWHALRNEVLLGFAQMPVKKVRNVVRRLRKQPLEVAPKTHNMSEGTTETTKELFRSKLNPIRLVRRVATEIETNAQRNPHLSEITAPVIIMSGARDTIANPKKILSQAEEEGLIHPLPNDSSERSEDSFFTDVDGREGILKNILPKSPYIRMMLAKKHGNHDLVFLRTKPATDAGWYLLERWHREQARNTGDNPEMLGEMVNNSSPQNKQ